MEREATTSLARDERFDRPAGPDVPGPVGVARAAAIASALLSAAFLVALAALPLYATLPTEWRGAAEYADGFEPISMLAIVPALLLVPAFVILAAAMHELAPQWARLFTGVGLTFAAMYGVLIAGNDLLQLTTVRLSLEHGRTDGLDPLVWVNPYGVFGPLEALGYAFQAVTVLTWIPLVPGPGPDRWLRVLFGLNGLLGLAGLVFVAVDVPWAVFAGLALWSVVFTVAMLLIARRVGRFTAAG